MLFSILVLFITFVSTPASELSGLLINDVDSSAHYESIDRATWEAKPPLTQSSLKHPVKLVIVSHTASRFCTSYEECSGTVRAIQHFHMETRHTDISYNFLIGGDSNIYEGRGWDVTNGIRNQSISVSFIGNYLSDHLSEDMVEAFKVLMDEGVSLGKLHKNYKIVCHNQTMPTLSPGVNVYKVVKTWPKFTPGYIKMNSLFDGGH